MLRGNCVLLQINNFFKIKVFFLNKNLLITAPHSTVMDHLYWLYYKASGIIYGVWTDRETMNITRISLQTW